MSSCVSGEHTGTVDKCPDRPEGSGHVSVLAYEASGYGSTLTAEARSGH